MEKSYADLPFELTIKIVEHIDSHDDFETFGLVCTNWRNAMKLTSRYTASHQTPWLMLPPEPLLKYSKKARFYRLYNHSIRRVDLPSLDDDTDSSDDSEEDSENDSDDDYFVGKRENCHRNLNSSRGWLVFLDYFGAREVNVSLVHPFTKERIRVPSLLYNKGAYDVYNDSIFALSDCPNSATSHYTLGVILRESWTMFNLAGFWNSKDKKWVVIAKLPYVQDVTDIAFYKGEFYVVDSEGRMVVASGFDDVIRPLIKKGTWISEMFSLWNKVYLVESAGMLLQVLLYYGFSENRSVSRFKVREVNVGYGETKEVKSLGNRALFLGPNSCFSMEASPHCCKPNCIYYVSDLGLHKNMGVYDLTSGQKIEDYIDPMLANLGTSFWVEAPSRL